MLQDNLIQLQSNVATALNAAGRTDSVRIVPASKRVSPEILNELFRLGIHEVGENQVQEYRRKIDVVDAQMKWHFIGQLQTNKVKYIIERVELVHSLDRDGLAFALDRQSAKLDRTVDALIEINIDNNPTHGGVMPEAAEAFVEAMSKYGRLRIRGLMTVLPPTETERACEAMQRLFEQLKNGRGDFDTLSMGMSGDYELAVRYGANLIRPGRVLFGDRSY